jgi:hypothetical protein
MNLALVAVLVTTAFAATDQPKSHCPKLRCMPVSKECTLTTVPRRQAHCDIDCGNVTCPPGVTYSRDWRELTNRIMTAFESDESIAIAKEGGLIIRQSGTRDDRYIEMLDPVTKTTVVSRNRIIEHFPEPDRTPKINPGSNPL